MTESTKISLIFAALCFAAALVVYFADEIDGAVV